MWTLNWGSLARSRPECDMEGKSEGHFVDGAGADFSRHFDGGAGLKSGATQAAECARESLSELDPESVHPGPDLIAALHLGVPGRQRVEERPIPASEIADADRAIGLGDHLEVPAGEELVRHAHMPFPPDHQAGG